MIKAKENTSSRNPRTIKENKMKLAQNQKKPPRDLRFLSKDNAA